MEQTNKAGLIFEKIPKIMSEIGAIGKDRENRIQNYSFRGIDDIYNAVHSALARNGVFVVPDVMEHTRVERLTKDKKGTLTYSIMKIRYRFYCTDGSFFDATAIGEGMDSGDKSSNKAMSAAQKYVFLQTFCIPTEEQKDSENDSPEMAPETQEQQQTEPKPVKIPDYSADALIHAIGVIKSKGNLNYKNVKKMLADYTRRTQEDGIDEFVRAEGITLLDGYLQEEHNSVIKKLSENLSAIKAGENTTDKITQIVDQLEKDQTKQDYSQALRIQCRDLIDNYYEALINTSVKESQQ